VLKRIFFYSAILWTGVILFLCLIKSSDLPKVNIENLDKVIHAFLHFVFTSLWFLYFKKQWSGLSKYRLLGFSLICSFIFGIAIELMQQYFTTTRTADVFDVLANLSGSVLAIISILMLNKFNGIVDKI
jgi:VanZ family protein